MRKAKYKWLRCYYSPILNEVIGYNWFEDKILDFLVWWDMEFNDSFGPITYAEDKK